MHAPTDRSGTSTRQFLLLVFLLWLAGNGLRITILAVPPVIPLIRTDLGMSETQVGILTGLPPVLFACAAVLGSLLIARFGALMTLIVGLLATAAGSALRGAAPDIWLLRRRHHASLAAAASARLAPQSHRIRHGRVHQRTAGRRDPAGGAHHSGGAAALEQ
jgi:cyanate permease